MKTILFFEAGLGLLMIGLGVYLSFARKNGSGIGPIIAGGILLGNALAITDLMLKRSRRF